ncbi:MULTISPECIES: nucleotide-binding protein [unclassified Bradyrhizobium]|uniref:nucleotide-binding protein n=1 Tax=unclassified Bradyrhizobium TaxID=2631580 RepID=UPI002916F3FD|nr:MULTISPECIES: nucleotide-binding protein [unclassified Bradyrhizobium]
MAKINQVLIDRLADDLGITAKAVYPHITKVANELMLDRHLAALVLAARRGINIHKYSTSAERAEVRGLMGGGRQRDLDDEPAERVAPAPARRRSPSKHKSARKRTKENTVFVVHGRDDALRKSMFEFLRALGLAPQEWQQALAAAKGNNPYVGDVIDEVMDQAQAVVVMLSPDDLVTLKEQFWKPDDGPNERKPQGQARPNVLFEAGMAMAHHPKKTVMVRIGRVKQFSDVFGRHIPSLGDDFDSRNDFANRLQKAGCTVDRTGTDWSRAGSFMPTEPKPAKKKRA